MHSRLIIPHAVRSKGLKLSKVTPRKSRQTQSTLKIKLKWQDMKAIKELAKQTAIQAAKAAMVVLRDMDVGP